MRIYIKLNTGRSFKIPAPMALIKIALGCGNFGLAIAKRYIPQEQRKYVENIDLKELKKGFDMLKAYKGLKMVEVKAGDGTEVTIIV